MRLIFLSHLGIFKWQCLWSQMFLHWPVTTPSAGSGQAVIYKLWWSGFCLFVSPPPLSGPVLEWLGVYWGADCTHSLCLDFLALIYCNNSTCPERPYITNLSYTSFNCLILSPNYLPPDFTSCYLFTTYSQNTKYQIAAEHQDLMGSWGMEKGNWITAQNLFFSFSIKTFFSLSG